MQADDCPLCRDAAAPALWRDDRCRVVSAADADYPAFLRVIWQAHVREMTDLDLVDQQHLLRVVLAVERVLRSELSPDKINLATLGNQVPHLHWHVIPRFADDAHFPDPVWAARRRAGVAHRVDQERLIEGLRSALGRSPAA
jgi:diadenosine tetraphosphate (Ap4A) HIT family hydrolase